MAHEAGAYPGFCSLKGLGVFLVSSGWNVSPLQGYSPALSSLVPIFIHLGGERYCEKASFPRTQLNVTSQDSNRDCSIQ